MLNWLLGHVRDTKHGGSVLRTYLWWGVVVRGVLLFGLFTLLVVRGNFLADWLLTLNLPAVPQANVEELGLISYVTLVLILTAGSVMRWELVRRLNAVPSGDESPSSMDKSTEK